MGKVKNFFAKRKASILQLVGSLGMLMVAAAIGIFLGLNKTNNIDKYVNEAIEYFESSNWTAMYQYAEVIDNDFINEVFFNQMAESLYGSVKEGEVTVEEIVEEDNEAYAVVSYKTDDGKRHNVKLYLDKKDEKNYMFFHQWKLSIDKTIIRDSQITVPVGFDVYMDGIELTRDNAHIESDETTGLSVYTIPRLFKGEHTMYLKKDGVDVVETTVTWNENKSMYQLDTTQLQLVQSQKDSITQSAEDIVYAMYRAIFDESGITEANVYFKQDETVQTMLTAVYDNMLAAINPEDGSTLSAMEITGFNHEALHYTYPNEVELTISFDCAFTARGARSDKGGVREKYEGTTSSQVTMHYVMVGDKWYCDNLNMTCIDYSKPVEEEAAQ